MDLQKIQSLLKIVADSGVAEVEIEEEGFKLTVRRSPASVTLQSPYYPAPMPYAMPPQPVAPNPAAPASSEAGARQQIVSAAGNAPQPATATAEVATAPGENRQQSQDEIIVKAPIVGTFYRRPSPDSDLYVEAGSKVKPGDVLCIIEAMKLMNEIECEVSGIVERVLVEDSQPVEYEQPLFVIRQES